MGTHSIMRLVPVRDAIDRLEWQVRIATDFNGPAEGAAFVSSFRGCLVFYRQPIPSNHGMGASTPRLALPARWTNSEEAARVRLRGEATFAFATDLPGDSLARIDAFREGGRLYVRLEGSVFVVYRSPRHAASGAAAGPWIDDVVGLLDRAGNNRLYEDVRSECLELRDLWCSEILPTLRPPGRVILEAQLPLVVADEEHGRRALGHLDVAQRAFDEGRYEEAARLVYKAGEALQQLGSQVEVRYGEVAQKNIAKQNSAVQALCHPDRHDESKVVGGHDTDRPMALHLITSMKSLAAVYLAGPPRSTA